MAPLTTPTITIRPAYADDDAALARLAILDSADGAPARPLLLAEVDGELKVALSLRDGAVIADPFAPTRDLIELLRTHAAPTPNRRRSVLARRHGRAYQPRLRAA
jgi:hypothetical protein